MDPVSEINDDDDDDKVWKAAGKPRSGPIFTNRERSRLDYRRLIKERQ